MLVTSCRLPVLILLIVLVSALGGCATGGGGSEPHNDAQTAVAEELFSRGDFHAAADAFLVLAEANSSGRNFYRLRAAEALREEGDLAGTARVLAEVKRKRLEPAEAVRFDLLDAEVALFQHDAARALDLLATPDNPPLSPALALRGLELTARAQAANGDAFGAARTRAALNRSLTGADRDQNERQIIDTLATEPAAALKQRAAALSPNDALRPWIEQTLRKQGQALPLTVLRPNRPVGTLQPESGQRWSREGFRELRRVGLLLPATGPLKSAATAIRDGFFAAYFTAQDSSAPRPEVKFYDSGSTAESALAAYQKAVADGADHVVGPLSREAVAALFDLSPLPVPLLAMNQADGGATPPPGSLAFGLTPDLEGAQAAEHMVELGLKEAAVLAASDDWAERAALAFRAQFESLGGQVVGEGRVRENEVNFAATIRQTVGSFASASGAGIFIAMRPQQARLLLPQLKLAGVTLPVYATSHVYAGSANPGLDRDLDGLEFCDAPWLLDAAPSLPRREDIARAIESARGAGARLFALGYDAYALLPYMDWIGVHPDSYLAGATGQLASDSFGRIHRLLTWARFDGGIARPVGGLSLAP